MEKIKPKLSMILLYAMLISVVLILILFYAERFIITTAENPELYIFLIVGLSIIGSISLSLRTFLRSYFVVEIDENDIAGPSLLGVGWRKVQIPLNEIGEISNNKILVLLGIYIIKSIKGEKICISGFDEEQFNKLMLIINSKRQIKI